MTSPIDQHRALAGRYVVTPTGCWEWTLSRLPKGYGALTTNKRRTYAHRLAYEVARGPIPKGMQVCHRCDNPPCVNPDHLFLGTNRDNYLDSHAKGRARLIGHVSRAEANGRAVLTWPVIDYIRRESAAGRSRVSIASEVGVSAVMVSKIARGVAWRDEFRRLSGSES